MRQGVNAFSFRLRGARFFLPLLLRSDLGFGNGKNSSALFQTFDERRRVKRLGRLAVKSYPCGPCLIILCSSVLGLGSRMSLPLPFNYLQTYDVTSQSIPLGGQDNNEKTYVLPTNHNHFAKLHWTGNRKKHTEKALLRPLTHLAVDSGHNSESIDLELGWRRYGAVGSCTIIKFTLKQAGKMLQCISVTHC